MLGEDWLEPDVQWLLLYTKPHAEVWAELNLRKQGFLPVLPRIRTRSGFAPLFPRYLFVGVRHQASVASLRGTLGISHIVRCGERPARVPTAVIVDVGSRMNEHGVVDLKPTIADSPLFARRQRERSEALAKLAAAGFRVKAA